MTIKDLQNICNSLKGVTQDIKWEDHLCFNVGAKMFLITSPDKIPHSASFKAEPDDFETLCQREGIIPAPYLARYKWVQIDDINRLGPSEWQQYLAKSYSLVFNKLPSTVKKKVLAEG